MKARRFWIPLLVCLSPILSMPASAQVPDSISYQGYLENGGIAVNDTSATLTFRLYDVAGGGTALWTETQTGVPISDGVFSVYLGSAQSLKLISFADARWLSTAIGDQTAPELSPRTSLSAAPYALSLRSLRVVPYYLSPNLIGGHYKNQVSRTSGGQTIGGGGSFDFPNFVSGLYGTVGGGEANESNGNWATVSGGRGNKAWALYATIGGGFVNTANYWGGTVAGGYSNSIGDTLAFVGGGKENYALAPFSTIGGGGGESWVGSNIVKDQWGTIGGGYGNRAGNNNPDVYDAGYATVSGGKNNQAQATHSTVGGGQSNLAVADNSTVGGGFANQANGPVSTVAGGWSNHADGERSAICGGRDNRSNGYAGAVPGGSNNWANGDYSFAAGHNARSIYHGCFTWADNSVNSAFECKTFNRWQARAAGGFYIYTNSGLTAGVYLDAAGSAWNTVSDRARKTDFEPLDSRKLLDGISSIDISSWRYRSQEKTIRHVGPTAQDFNSLLPFLGGEGEKYINSLDADGVALAAIQGLYELVQDQQAEIEHLKEIVDTLK